MLSERLLTGVMRAGAKRLMALSPVEPGLPDPVPGRDYLLYVHVPFCERLCPYCSFNRYPFDQGLATSYFASLRDEMRAVADKGYDFASMYIGGGTPTVDLDELIATIDLAKELFSIREVSSETNPNHLYPRWVDPLVDRVDRFSVGVQSFDDGLLKQMDRYDKYGSAEEILERLRSIEGRFHSLNVDMIFNFPSQTAEQLRRDCELLKSTGANQTTFYPLMASPAVELSLKKSVGKVDYAREGRYYELLSQELSDTFEPASAWTFSRIAGGMIDEYIVDYEDYVGIGSGAFSFLDGALYVNTFSLREYGRLVSGPAHSAVVSTRVFGKKDRMRYRFLMSLFGLGLDRTAFWTDFGVPVERGLAAEVAFFRANDGFERDDKTCLVPSARGRYLAVVLMREFFISVNSLRDQARSALPAEESRLLFGDGSEECAAVHAGHPLAEADASTEAAEDTLPR